MQVKVAARHGHLNEEHQAQLQERAQKLLTFFDRLIFIEVTVDFLKDGEKNVEVIAKAEHKHEFVGHAQAEDLLVAMHGAVEKVTHQIKHYKERVQDHRRDPARGGSSGPSH